MGQALPKFSLDDFLAWENLQAEKHEFVQGEVFAMVGARRVHGLVCLNLAASLKQQLRGTRCAVFAETMKVQTADDTLLYPDIFVTCDDADLRTEQVFRAPTVVVEVLSPTTEGYDRGLKFALYRELASLREYALVHPDTREVLLFRRGVDGLFTLHDFTGRDEVRFDSIGCTVSAADLFEGVVAAEGTEPSPP